MTRKPEIEKSRALEIDKILKESGEFFKSGNVQKSLELAMTAWEMIPDPKEKWDYYPQSLSSGFVQDYTDLGDKKNTLKWIEIMAKMYDDEDHRDHFVLMTEGESMYKLRDFDRAYYVFGRILEIFGRSGFAGEQLNYLKFYLDEKAKRGG